MLVRDHFVRVGEVPNLVPEICDVVQKFGGPYSEWYCETTSDAEEALARHGVLRFGQYLWVPFETLEGAVQTKKQLGQLGFYTPRELRTRGGCELYCFRIRMWNCHTIR